MIGVLIKRGNFGYGQTCTEEICYEATEKMLPIRNAKDCQKWSKERRKEWNRSSFMALRRKNPVDPRPPASKTVRQYISVVLSHQVCAILLWWS